MEFWKILWHSIFIEHYFSVRNLPWQLANADGFAEAYLCFLVSALAKKYQGN